MKDYQLFSKNLIILYNDSKLLLYTLLRMSFMFSGLFGSSIVTEETKSEIIKNIYCQNTDSVISTINHNNIDPDDNNLIDESQQNLLHLACRTRNLELAKFLINKKINKQKVNIFKETPLDIAIKNQDKKMIEILLNSNYVPYQTDLTYKISKLTDDLNCEKKNYKRQRDECELLSTDNSKLKEENVKLVIENKKLKVDNNELQKTVKTLRESFKK